jgi:hypothetical protein
MSSYTIASSHNDSDTRFYIPPEGATDTKTLGYAEQIGLTQDFLMRMTPGTVELDRRVPVDFTVHVKALRDFGDLNPIILELRPVVARGSARFGLPVATSAPGEPDIRLDGERIVITMNRTDKAARVFVHADYPPDGWAGFSKVSVEAHVQATANGQPQPAPFALCVEGNVIVKDRMPKTGGSASDRSI